MGEGVAGLAIEGKRRAYSRLEPQRGSPYTAALFTVKIGESAEWHWTMSSKIMKNFFAANASVESRSILVYCVTLWDEK